MTRIITILLAAIFMFFTNIAKADELVNILPQGYEVTEDVYNTLPNSIIYDSGTDLPPYTAPIVLNNYDLQQITCMTDNVYYEARGEPIEGQIAVDYVVLNRAYSGKYPTSPCEVVYQRTRNVCQFSWVCSKRHRAIKEPELYNALYTLCTQVYLERIPDNTEHALFYHEKHIHPKWSKQMLLTVEIGRHIFYKGKNV